MRSIVRAATMLVHETSTMSRRHTNAARTHFKATDPDIWVSVPRAAKLLGVTRNTIYNWVAVGKLQADHVAGRLVIRRASMPDSGEAA